MVPAHPSHAAPLPSLARAPAPRRRLSLLPPRAHSSREGSVPGIKRRGRGKGRRRRKGDDPFRGGVEFQLPTLGPNCAPQPGPSPRHLLPRDRAAGRRVVGSARSGELGSARHAPALPRRPHASPCLPFISPTSVFPEGGERAASAALGYRRFHRADFAGFGGNEPERSRGARAWGLGLNKDPGALERESEARASGSGS